MTIIMVIILCFLGNWQVERLNWKLDLTQKLETRYDLPPVPIPATVKDTDAWLYRHVSVSGRFLHMREMPLYSIGPTGRPGYDLFTPLLISGDNGAGKYVIVNRGWVPENLKEQVSRPETIKSGQVHVTGVLRKSWARERFAPENDPVHNLWFFGDIKAMSEAQHMTDVFPMFLYADKSLTDGEYPIGGRTRLKLINNHLDYAMTWYGLAIVLVIIYLIFSLQKVRRSEEHF
ncbi:Cytochrome oxidase biogenesis protein Surf1, facilitates heme A insertion [hydrothermal vent metagenome]|uniref:Cytochrome oxidase biogenesis protein Surf1, facilitates heme A insertion n=1 Tax=hydrothermal vent metagenome TaxID=652676 RepID=A0A3B0TFB1_9ZZZZ